MKFLTILIILLYPGIIFAQDYTLGLKAGSSWGKSQNNNHTISNRAMLTHEISAQPGIHSRDWTFGLVAGWRFRRQLTEPSQVSNTNLRGGGYHLGFGAKYDFSKWSMLGELDLSTNYRLSNLDPVGQEIKYKCLIGLCGIGISAQTNIWNDYLLELGFRYQRWGRVDVNKVKNDISDNRLTEWRLYLGTGRYFSL